MLRTIKSNKQGLKNMEKENHEGMADNHVEGQEGSLLELSPFLHKRKHKPPG